MASKYVVVCSFHRSIGKTMFILGLSEILREYGFKIGYFKPLGIRNYMIESGNLVDEDAHVVKNFLKLTESTDEISPLTYHYDLVCKTITMKSINAIKRRILNLARKISKDKDLVFVEGSGCLWTGLSIGLSSVDLSKYLNAPLIILVRYDPVFICDWLLVTKSIIESNNVNCLGVVIIGASKKEIETLTSCLLTEIKDLKLEILGSIPPLRNVIPMTVREIAEATDSKVLFGDEFLDLEVENILVGAMTPDSALRYFRVTPRKMVITGGDREDIILTALKTDTRAILLTGDIMPSSKVVNVAKEASVPLLLSPYDTYNTLKRIEEYGYKIKYLTKERIQKLRDTIKSSINVEYILQSIK